MPYYFVEFTRLNFCFIIRIPFDNILVINILLFSLAAFCFCVPRHLLYSVVILSTPEIYWILYITLDACVMSFSKYLHSVSYFLKSFAKRIHILSQQKIVQKLKGKPVFVSIMPSESLRHF